MERKGGKVCLIYESGREVLYDIGKNGRKRKEKYRKVKEGLSDIGKNARKRKGKDRRGRKKICLILEEKEGKGKKREGRSEGLSNFGKKGKGK